MMMATPFTHFLITRYNVSLAGWEKDRSGQSTRDEAWYLHRKKLFDQFCVPSIRQQSNKAFTWLIYCDSLSPYWVLEEINKSVSSLPQATVRLVTGYQDCMQDIDTQMSRVSTPYVITSRLDNDDGLGLDFMATVQANFIEQPGTILNLLNGHGYNENRKVITQLINMQKNHFGSLIELRKPAGGHTSIRGFQHGAPPAHFKIINIPHRNSWLKLFHDRNLKSSVFGYPVFNASVHKLYGIDQRHMPVSKMNTLRYSIWWLTDGLYRKMINPFSN